MRIFFIGIFVFFTVINAGAQINDTESGNYGIEPGFSLSFEQLIHLQDYYLKFGLGVEESRYDWSAHLGFAFRPFHKKIVLKERDLLYRQFQEKRFFLSLNFNKQFYFVDFDWSKLGPFLGVQGGLVFASYTGTSKAPAAFWTISPQAGAAWQIEESVTIKLGYQYLNDGLENVDDFRFNLGVNFNLSK